MRGLPVGFALLVAACGGSGGDQNESERSSASGGAASGGAATGGSAYGGSATGVSGHGVSGNAGSGHGGSANGSFPSCQLAPSATDGVIRFTGEVNNQTIDLEAHPRTGGFTQNGAPPGSKFNSPNPVDDEPAGLFVTLKWQGVIADGQKMATQGSVRMPQGAPLAGQTLCVGTGSTIYFVPKSEQNTAGDLQFYFAGLSTGADCNEPLEGELYGCWAN